MTEDYLFSGMEAAANVKAAWEAIPEETRCAAETLGDYYAALCRVESNKSEQAAARLAKDGLFGLLCDRQIDVPFGEALVKDLCGAIPLRSPEPEAERFMKRAVAYLSGLQKKPVTGKLYLLLMGDALDKCGREGEKSFHEQLDWLWELSFRQKANLTGITDTTLRGYFGWILPVVGRNCNRPEEMERVFSMFTMTRDGEARFLTECLPIYYGRTKAEKDNHSLCMYLGFALRHADAECARAMGNALREQLGKPKLKELEQSVRTVYHNDKTVMSGWSELAASAGIGGGFGKLGGLFRR